MNNSLDKSNTERIDAFFREVGTDLGFRSQAKISASTGNNDRLVIQDPTVLGWKLINFTKTLQKVVENNSQIAIINTGGRYGQQYADM